jgi:hypothetical protein
VSRPLQRLQPLLLGRLPRVPRRSVRRRADDHRLRLRERLEVQPQRGKDEEPVDVQHVSRVAEQPSEGRLGRPVAAQTALRRPGFACRPTLHIHDHCQSESRRCDHVMCSPLEYRRGCPGGSCRRRFRSRGTTSRRSRDVSVNFDAANDFGGVGGAGEGSGGSSGVAGSGPTGGGWSWGVR